MKRVISFLSVCLMILSFPAICFANTENMSIEYFEDGSYCITIIGEGISTRASSNTVTKPKTANYYDSNGNLQWSVTITGTFNYNGSSASCTNASVSYRIYNDNWKVTESKASRSGATAKGEFTVKKYLLGVPIKTINKTVTLTCSKDGTFS